MKSDNKEENQKTGVFISKTQVLSKRTKYSDPLFMMYKRFSKKRN